MQDNTMWALVKEKPEQGLWMKRVPIPTVGPTDVKIKIHKTSSGNVVYYVYTENTASTVTEFIMTFSH
jgi:threonine 3-dehydrogenase